MPRRTPTNVNEHRLTFGTFERDVLKPVLKAQAARDNTRTAVIAGVGVLGAGAVVGVGWLAFEAFMLTKGFQSEYEATKDKIKTAVEASTVGLKSYKTSDDTPTIFRDPNDPSRRINPAAGVPIVGALFGLGMVVGEKTNPFPQTDAVQDAAQGGQASTSDGTTGDSWWDALRFSLGGGGVY